MDLSSAVCDAEICCVVVSRVQNHLLLLFHILRMSLAGTSCCSFLGYALSRLLGSEIVTMQAALGLSDYENSWTHR